jgi:hypothetical protein
LYINDSPPDSPTSLSDQDEEHVPTLVIPEVMAKREPIPDIMLFDPTPLVELEHAYAKL